MNRAGDAADRLFFGRFPVIPGPLEILAALISERFTRCVCILSVIAFAVVLLPAIAKAIAKFWGN